MNANGLKGLWQYTVQKTGLVKIIIVGKTYSLSFDLNNSDSPWKSLPKC